MLYCHGFCCIRSNCDYGRCDELLLDRCRMNAVSVAFRGYMNIDKCISL